MKSMLRLQTMFWVATVAFGLAAVGDPAAVYAQSTLQEIQKRGKLLAGVRFSSPPMGYIDAQGNNIGFGPDIAREFAKHLGVEVEFVQSTSRTRIPLLVNGQVDAGFGPTTPNKTRDEVIDFSYTYVVAQAVIMVRQGESTDPETYFNSDKIVGVKQGSFYVDLWKQHSPGAKMKEYQEFPELVIALAQGKVDVIPAPEATAYGLIEKLGPRAKNIAVGGVFFQDPQAITVRENDSDWRDWTNWALQRMWAEGTFQKIYKKHFKSEPPFNLGDAGRLSPGYEKIAKENDPW